MSLREYNCAQIKEIRKYIIENGGNPDDDIGENTLRLELEWLEKDQKQFRKKWEEESRDAVSC